jgi:uncharacterized repeat protein (TIGR03803 family)
VGEGWIFSPLYSFGSQEHDGFYPLARVLFGPDGLLYGTTSYGGAFAYGTVFRLQPPATTCKSVLCPWIETVIYSFTGGADGGIPQYGDLAFDQAGNIYGTTYGGGASGDGVVFELTRSGRTAAGTLPCCKISETSTSGRSLRQPSIPREISMGPSLPREAPSTTAKFSS